MFPSTTGGYPSVRNSAPNLYVWLFFTQVMFALNDGLCVIWLVPASEPMPLHAARAVGRKQSGHGREPFVFDAALQAQFFFGVVVDDLAVRVTDGTRK